MSEQSTQLPTEIENLRKQALNSLYVFTFAVLGYNKLVKSLHLPIARKLESRKHLRKLVAAPRGSYKTTLAVIAYSLWRICKNPNIRILWAYNTSENGEAKLSELMAHVETNRRFQACFPEIIPDFGKTTWTKKRVIFPRTIATSEGTIDVAGVSTDLASRHYNLIIEDDPIAAKRDQMRSEELLPNREDIEKGIGMHKMLYALRAPDSPGLEFERLVSGTRWCMDDLVGWILANESDYDATIVSAENEDGESAFPDWRTTEDLHQDRDVRMGPYIYSSQMLMQPIAAELQDFKPEWLNFKWHHPHQQARKFIFLDPNHKGSGTGSKAGIVPLMTTPDGHLDILPCLNYRTEPDILVRIMIALVRDMTGKGENPPTVVLEDVAGQHILEPYLRELMSPDQPFQIIERKPTTRLSKDARILGLTPWASAQRIRFPEKDGGALEVKDIGLVVPRSAKALRDQMVQFPFGKDKDLVDALAMAPYEIRFPSEVEEAQIRDVHSAQEALRRIKEKNAHRLSPESQALPMTKMWDNYEETLVLGRFGRR